MSLLGKMLGFGRNENYDRGIRCFDQGQYEEAIDAFRIARERGGSRPDPLTDKLASFYTAESYAHLGHAAMKNGNWERAQNCFENALKIHPHYADLHFQLALSRRACRKLELAFGALDAALKINPRFAKAHFYSGLVSYELGDHDRGLKSIIMALDLEPGFRTEAFAQGQRYHEAGDNLAALQAFERVSHTDVDDILFHYRLGDDLYKRGLYDDAAAEYQKALSLNPNYADIRNHLGIAYSANGLYSEAINEFEAAIAINPEFLEAILNLAITLRDRGRIQPARSYFTLALKIEPENPIALANLSSDALLESSESDAIEPRAA